MIQYIDDYEAYMCSKEKGADLDITVERVLRNYDLNPTKICTKDLNGCRYQSSFGQLNLCNYRIDLFKNVRRWIRK